MLFKGPKNDPYYAHGEVLDRGWLQYTGLTRYEHADPFHGDPKAREWFEQSLEDDAKNTWEKWQQEGAIDIPNQDMDLKGFLPLMQPTELF